jgi:hypothetical protein
MTELSSRALAGCAVSHGLAVGEPPDSFEHARIQIADAIAACITAGCYLTKPPAEREFARAPENHGALSGSWR